MKKLSRLLFGISIFLLSGCVSTMDDPRTLYIDSHPNLVPRFCFARNDHTLNCYRNRFQCNEAEHEDRFLNNVESRRSCNYLLINRGTLPYWEQ